MSYVRYPSRCFTHEFLSSSQWLYQTGMAFTIITTILFMTELKRREGKRELTWDHGLSEVVTMEIEPREFNPGIWTRNSRIQGCNPSTYHLSFLWLWYAIFYFLCLYIIFIILLVFLALWPGKTDLSKKKEEKIFLITLILTTFSFLTMIHPVALSYVQLRCLESEAKDIYCTRRVSY